jgi:hypothetical protein
MTAPEPTSKQYPCARKIAEYSVAGLAVQNLVTHKKAPS